MEINLLTFGSITEIIGESSLVYSDLNNTDLLVKKLHDAFPELASIKYSIAVNQKLVHTNTKLNDKDTVALLPPFSGG